LRLFDVGANLFHRMSPTASGLGLYSGQPGSLAYLVTAAAFPHILLHESLLNSLELLVSAAGGRLQLTWHIDMMMFHAYLWLMHKQGRARLSLVAWVALIVKHINIWNCK
jgi:hypothetical protein